MFFAVKYKYQFFAGYAAFPPQHPLRRHQGQFLDDVGRRMKIVIVSGREQNTGE
jgi:hypothetical protein